MLLSVEKDLISEYTLVCGVDEAGRGPLAGPVYAAAVILPEGLEIEGLNDSKKLSELKRERLYEVITEKAHSWSVSSASESEIDEYNILQATFLAMRRAVESLGIKPNFALIDGNRPPNLNIPLKCIIGGDGIYSCIAAASVLAKVTRDRFMYTLAKDYPEYEFDRHKGYGTALHYEKLRKYGPSPVHRLSFLKKMH
jgi:ribonuclease HII